MKPTIKIYVGRPVSGAEANALRRLHAELSERGVEALLLVNFTARSRQIDCLVVTMAQATLLDFKEITGPVCGGLNGPWFIRAHGGGEVRYPGENPYVEVSTAKYALSDEMASFQRGRHDVPSPSKKRFYEQFDAAVCICPDIVAGSKLPPGDFKCWIWGFPAAVEKICGRRIESSWGADHWERFAREHLTLELVSLDGATDADFRKAELSLSAYCADLLSLLSHNLPPELPGFQEALPQTEHFVLLGPSGIGKTIRLRHHAIQSVKQGALMLFLEAMHYAGEFRALLQKGVAASFAGRIEELGTAASTCATPTVLIVDGFDRCREPLRPALGRDIVAFHKRCNCRAVIGSQIDPDLPPILKGQIIQMQHLTPPQRLAVFQFHAGDPSFSDSGLLEPFETSHDLMVAAKCRSRLAPGATRTEVYDAYVAQCLPAKHATIAGALCRHLAAALTRDFASAMTLHEFEHLTECFVENCSGPLGVVDEIRQTDLVKLSPAGFSFRHELIQEHLYGEWLCRSAESSDALLSELQKPAHHHLAEAILSRERSPLKITAVLSAALDDELPMRVYRGRCGAVARQVVLRDCQRLLSDAAADLVNLTVDWKLDAAPSGKATLIWIEIANYRKWSAYETRLASFIGRAVDTPEFAEPVAELFVLTGTSLHLAATTAAQRAGRSVRATFDGTLHSLLALLGGSMLCPAGQIFHTWRHSLFGPRTEANAGGPWVSALWSRLTKNTAAGAQAVLLWALCELYEWTKAPPPDALARTFRLCWDTRLRSLRMKALAMLTSAARSDTSGGICGDDNIRSLLQTAVASTPNRDIFLSTCVIEAMNALGMLQAPVDLEGALREIRSLLNPPSDYARRLTALEQSEPTGASCNPLAELAYGVIGRFFEEVFQGVYFEAFGTLTEGEQIAFLSLAAQAKDPSFHLGWILGRLVKVCSPSSLPVFQRYAAGVLVDSPDPLGVVRAFLLAVIGCAKLRSGLPPWRMERTDAAEAWRIIREIVYEHFKEASTRERINDLWLALRAEAPLGSADALYNIQHPFVLNWGGEDLRADLTQFYPQQTKAILEHGLLNLEKLTSAWKFGRAEERNDFVVATLGRVGDESSVEILKRFANHPVLGKGAIGAIKAIKARIGSKRAATPP
jgi:hypothetical protein